MGRLTDLAIKKAIAASTKKPGWLSIALPGRGSGSLALRVARGRGLWYYRYRQNGKLVEIPLGETNAYPQTSLAEAQRLTMAMVAKRLSLPDGDLKSELARQEYLAKRVQQTEISEAERAGLAPIDAGNDLARLIALYVDYLESAGKASSAKVVRNSFAYNVLAPYPALAKLPAKQITNRDITQILRSVLERGKGRTAGKLRAYLRAAYALAVGAENNPEAPSGMLALGVSHNPVADTASLSRYNKTRDRVLGVDEIRAFWRQLSTKQGVAADALRAVLLLGGQRGAQLLRARHEHLDLAVPSLTLYDPKGRRNQPRSHTLPLPAPVIQIMRVRASLAQNQQNPWLFSAGRATPLTVITLSRLVSSIRDELLDSGEARPFQFCDLRRTAETQLARLGVSRDIRAQIQSHGLGGVQARHYDRHDYMDEKLEALDMWATWLTES